MVKITAVIAALLTLLITVNAVSTTCGFVNLDYNNEITLTTGESGYFTLTAFNQGTTTQRIAASAECNPNEIDCSFSGIGENTLLAPSEQKVFALQVSPSVSGSFSIPGEFRAGPSSPTCTASLQFILNSLSQQTGSVQPLSAWIEPLDSQAGRPGDTIEYTLGLKNNLNKKIFATITDEDTNPFKTSTTLSASNIALDAGETEYVQLTVRLPPGTPGGTYRWIYKVDAGNCCDYNIELPVEIIVDGPLLSVQLLGSPSQAQCTAVNAGSTVSIPLSVENLAEVTGPFELSIQGSTTVTSIVSVTEPRFSLENGEEHQLQIRISPSTRTPVDTYTYKLRGTYQGFIFLERSFCFDVNAVESATISAPENVVIERMRLSTTIINVSNTGTTTDEYALSINPTEELNVVIQPSSFALNPGQMQQVALSISSDLTTSLGERTIALRLDGQNYTKNVQLNATVYATGRRGESLFGITNDREISFVKGVTKTFNVTVENLGLEVLRDAEVTLDGVNAEWYQGDSGTILPGGVEVFTITLTIPEGAGDQVNANITARSGLEYLSEPVTFTATNVIFDFVIDEIIENRNANEETTSVDLLVNVTNNGVSSVTQVYPLINDLNYIYVQTPPSLTLQPGQSAQVKINLKPGQSNVASQNVSIQFAAQEGVSSPHSVLLPQLTIAQTNLTMKIALVLVLLIAIVAVLAKTQKQDF